MRALIFGATGMTGQAALRAALLDARIEHVRVVSRRPVVPPALPDSKRGRAMKKLETVIHDDFLDFTAVSEQFKDVDMCLYCLGMSAAGVSEAQYARITYDMPMAAAAMLKAASPDCVFVYVSAAGADSTEQGRIMWARVKGRVENALMAFGFPRTYMFRPGYIQPLDGIKSRTASYRWLYYVLGPFYGLWKRLSPNGTTTTRILGRAMVNAAIDGNGEPIIESKDFARLAGE